MGTVLYSPPCRSRVDRKTVGHGLETTALPLFRSTVRCLIIGIQNVRRRVSGVAACQLRTYSDYGVLLVRTFGVAQKYVSGRRGRDAGRRASAPEEEHRAVSAERVAVRFSTSKFLTAGTRPKTKFCGTFAALVW